MENPKPFLDDPVRAALEGPHAPLAERWGGLLRYPPALAPFGAVLDARDADWPVAAGRTDAPVRFAQMARKVVAPPAGWTVLRTGVAIQMTDEGVAPVRDPRVVRLTEQDVPAMLDLVRRTEPGPFSERTIELGAYWGVRQEGRLVAMAGERFHAPGWIEISGVCSDPDYRGRGLAGATVLQTIAGIHERGERGFLHVFAENEGARRLYRLLGFVDRAELSVLAATPAAQVAA